MITLRSGLRLGSRDDPGERVVSQCSTDMAPNRRNTYA